MQTLNLGHLLNDAKLEGVVLGIIYSTETETKSGRQDLKLRSGKGVDVEQTECLMKAVAEVESKRMMEGIMDVGEGGRVSFLVYRVD